MAKIIGMNNGGNQPPQQQVKLDFSKAKEIVCQECGGSIFISGTKFLKINKIGFFGTPNDFVIPIPVQLCGDCGEICEELLPLNYKHKRMAKSLFDHIKSYFSSRPKLLGNT